MEMGYSANKTAEARGECQEAGEVGEVGGREELP